MHVVAVARPRVPVAAPSHRHFLSPHGLLDPSPAKGHAQRQIEIEIETTRHLAGPRLARSATVEENVSPDPLATWGWGWGDHDHLCPLELAVDCELN